MRSLVALAALVPFLCFGADVQAKPRTARAKPGAARGKATRGKATPTRAKRRPKAGKSTRPKATKIPVKVLKHKPKYLLQVQFVRLADDDGGRASTLTKANAQAAIDRANAVYARNGGEVGFAIHPASNFDNLIKSTTLNRDCILPPGQTAETIATHTNPDLDGDGEPKTIADMDMLCDYSSSINARTGYAIARANRIIVWSRGGNDRIKYDSAKGHWVLYHPSGGSSSAKGYYVNMPKSFGGSTLLAHEFGHYLHNAHTFWSAPKTVAEARATMEAFAQKNPGQDPRRAFDGDWHVYKLADTPPDPRGALFETVHGDACHPSKGTINVQIKVAGKNKTVTLAPDRSNVMSYFKGCDFNNFHLSPGQHARIRNALHHGNRKGLIEGKGGSCYSSGHMPGDLKTTEEKLILEMRRIAKCLLLQKEPMPWETVMTGEIYTNPAVRPGRSRSKVRRMNINRTRERNAVRSMTSAKFVH